METRHDTLPWGRDNYGDDAYHRWLAKRGYAVPSVNSRASTGFGKAFRNAGDLQWGRKMHDDLLDFLASQCLGGRYEPIGNDAARK